MSQGGDRERLERLMVAAIDDELGPDERGELDRALGADPALAREYQQMKEVKEMTRSFGYREPPEEVWAEFPGRVYDRFERRLAWSLLSLGAVILAVFGLYEMFRDLFTDPDVPRLVCWAVVSLVVGGALLVSSVVRERLLQRRRDPYEKVER